MVRQGDPAITIIQDAEKPGCLPPNIVEAPDKNSRLSPDLRDGPTRRSLILPLTGIRFFAALAVFLFHYGAGFGDRFGVPGYVSRFLHHGYLGVSLFFVLSGFVLTHTYGRGLNSKRSIAEFYVARLARIYPVYLLALVVALPTLERSLDLGRVFAVLLMVQSWGPATSYYGYAWVMQAWTLSIELFFYLVFPALIILLNRMTRRVLFLTTGGIAVLIVVFATPTISPGAMLGLPVAAQALIPLPLIRLLEFGYGMLLCRISEQAPIRASTVGRNDFLTIANIIFIILSLSMVDTAQILSFATLSVGVLIVQLTVGKGVVTRMLSTKTMVLLGTSSYAMYILQQPVREWVRIMAPEHVGALINPIILLVTSVLVYLLYERCAQRYLRGAIAGRAGR